jgi:uroporphyrinogen decarboxylase
MKQECKKEIDELAEGGRFILATGCEFPPNGSLMNAIAMMEAAELYGKY